jgi:hypothetical protein
MFTSSSFSLFDPASGIKQKVPIVHLFISKRILNSINTFLDYPTFMTSDITPSLDYIFNREQNLSNYKKLLNQKLT